MNPSNVKAQFENVLLNAPTELIKSHTFFELPCNQPPWFDTGIDLQEGENVTSFASGKTYLKDTDLSFEAGFQLWFRIGLEGQIFRGTRNSHSFTTEKSGRLYFASYFPSEWSTPTGELATPEEVYELVDGVLQILLIRWKVEPLLALNRLMIMANVPDLLIDEIERLTNPDIPPEGWQYLWFLGEAEIYHTQQNQHEGCNSISCYTHNDGGILQKSLSLPLIENSLLRWAWKMDELPSKVREDSLPTHDYLSIAVEFDNGQDITYFWSAELSVETGFRCPIPTWTARETHVVVRSGIQNLGQWFNEERNLYNDYQQFIGGEMPSKIVKVWLIAVSLFQHQKGLCEYKSIRFVSDGNEIVM